MTAESLSEAVFTQEAGDQRRPPTAFAVFQVRTAPDNQHSKASCFNKEAGLRGHVLNSYSHILRWHILLPFSVFVYTGFSLCSFASRWRMSRCTGPETVLLPTGQSLFLSVRALPHQLGQSHS